MRITAFNMSGLPVNNQYDYEGQVDYRLYDFSELKGTECYCDDEAYEYMRQQLSNHNMEGGCINLIDNGNYHYLSKILGERISEPHVMVVLDNHPDMQPPMFGDILSCGGWVRDLMEANPMLKQVYLVGVKQELITQEMRAEVEFVSGDTWDKCISDLRALGLPVYISIDKDVLEAEQYATNWDQGHMELSELMDVVGQLHNSCQVLAVDICGGVDRGMMETLTQQQLRRNVNVNSKLIELLG